MNQALELWFGFKMLVIEQFPFVFAWNYNALKWLFFYSELSSWIFRLCYSVTYLRLDGSVEPGKRFEIVKAFNSDPTIDVLLLTTHGRIFHLVLIDLPIYFSCSCSLIFLNYIKFSICSRWAWFEPDICRYPCFCGAWLESDARPSGNYDPFNDFFGFSFPGQDNSNFFSIEFDISCGIEFLLTDFFYQFFRIQLLL